MSRISCYVLCLATVGPLTVIPTKWAGAQPADAVEAAKRKSWQAIDTGSFADAIHHARMKYKDDQAPYARYKPDQIIHIAENLLAWQNGDGGWPKNVDWVKILSDEEQTRLPHGRPGPKAKRSTLDNRTTWTQIDYLLTFRTFV